MTIDFELQGQVAIVTGGGRGIGQATAIALARAGASVTVAARTVSEIEETAAIIGREGGRALACPTDVSIPDAVARMVAETERRLGAIDVLVNDAGVPGPLGPLWEADVDEWWETLAINLRGPFLCCRAVLPSMLARGRGRIINVSSGTGRMVIPWMSAYATSKCALTRLTELLASEVQDRGVLLFALEPGTVRTRMAEYALESPAGRRWMPWFREIFRKRKDITAEEAAGYILELASGRADDRAGSHVRFSGELPAIG